MSAVTHYSPNTCRKWWLFLTIHVTPSFFIISTNLFYWIFSSWWTCHWSPNPHLTLHCCERPTQIHLERNFFNTLSHTAVFDVKLYFCLFHHSMPVITAFNNHVLMYSNHLLTVERLLLFAVSSSGKLSFSLCTSQNIQTGELMCPPSLMPHFDHTLFLL